MSLINVIKINPVFITIIQYLQPTHIAILLQLNRAIQNIVMRHYCIKTPYFRGNTLTTLQLIHNNPFILFKQCNDCTHYNHNPCVFSRKTKHDISYCHMCKQTHIDKKNKFFKCPCGFKCINANYFTQCIDCGEISCNKCEAMCLCD